MSYATEWLTEVLQYELLLSIPKPSVLNQILDHYKLLKEQMQITE